MRLIQFTLLSAVMLTSSGCLFQKKPTVKAPVPAAPAPVASVPTTPTPAPTPTPTPVQQTPTTPPADTPKPSPFPPATTARPVTPAPVKPIPAPALGAILGADQRAKLEANYQSDLKQANQILTKVTGKGLTAQQLDSVSRARAFIRQAGQYHDRDLSTAAELARRARVLTDDLAASLK